MTNDFFAGMVAGSLFVITIVAAFQVGLNRGFDLAVTILNKDKNELLQNKSKVLLYANAQDRKS
jgi:hypothetical protein